MKAQEAAKWVMEQKQAPAVEAVEKLIPEYANILPRRAWIVKFLANLPKDIASRYSDL